MIFRNFGVLHACSFLKMTIKNTVSVFNELSVQNCSYYNADCFKTD